MKNERWKFSPEHIILTLTSIGQILITIFTYKHPVNSAVRNTGWIILWLSGIFGILPIPTFKKYGEIEKGKSYIQTQQLVDTGIYSIVRHPQYLAGILISIGLYLIAPGAINLILGIANILQYTTGTIGEESRLVEKFGDEYIQYTRKVPRLNFIWGIIKWFKRERGEN